MSDTSNYLLMGICHFNILFLIHTKHLLCVCVLRNQYDIIPKHFLRVFFFVTKCYELKENYTTSIGGES